MTDKTRESAIAATRKTPWNAIPFCAGLILGLVVTSLAAPLSAQTLVGDGTITCGATHVVVPGDTLGELADRAYGKGKLFETLVEANADVLNNDPDSLQVGMSIKIPCLDSSGLPVSAEMTASIEAAVAVEGPLTPADLDALFGPVALFPDVVLTNVLVASTFPLDVVKGGRFIAENQDKTDQARAKAAVEQPWDESAKQLAAAFPDLLTRMSDHIDWTEQVGEAVIAQTDDVLASIQRLRAKAKENGHLVDNQAQKIGVTDGMIVIEPATPGVIYVPTYDTQVVYTTHYGSHPDYYYGYDYYDDDWDDALRAGAIFLGAAIILNEIFDDNDWGDHWDGDANINWNGGDINIDRGDREFNIGDGDRPGIGGGIRPGTGEGIRPGTGEGGRLGAGNGDRNVPSLADLPKAGNRGGLDGADREVARQKIETRKATNQGVATLPATRPSKSNVRTRTPSAMQPGTSNRGSSLSRPTTRQSPSMQPKYPSNAFSNSGGAGARAAGSRGRSGGGGGRRR